MKYLTSIGARITAACRALKSRLDDALREARIERYARLALLAQQHGHHRACLIHSREMAAEMAQRSTAQKERIASRNARFGRARGKA